MLQKMIALIGLSQRRCMKNSATSDALIDSDEHGDDDVRHARHPKSIIDAPTVMTVRISSAASTAP